MAVGAEGAQGITEKGDEYSYTSNSIDRIKQYDAVRWHRGYVRFTMHGGVPGCLRRVPTRVYDGSTGVLTREHDPVWFLVSRYIKPVPYKHTLDVHAYPGIYIHDQHTQVLPVPC